MENNFPRTYEEALKVQNLFWSTQPVPKINEIVSSYGPIEKEQDNSSIGTEALKISDQFQWDIMDVRNIDVCNTLTEFLNKHFIKNSNELKYRSYYTTEYVQWLLCRPNHDTFDPELCVGVRVKQTNALVGFISANITNYNIRRDIVKIAQVNFLCVHDKLRNKRLTPLLIKELRRRLYHKNCYQALYNNECYLPKPFTKIECYNRALDLDYLVQSGFTRIESGVAVDDIKSTLKLPSTPLNKQFMPLDTDNMDDVGVTWYLLNSYLKKKYVCYPIFSLDEFIHIFCNKAIVTPYILKKDGIIKEFTSYYNLPIKSYDNNTIINVGYLFYYTSFIETPYRLIKDMMIVAKNNNVHLLNAFSGLEHTDIMRELNFEPSTKNIYYYFYNWRCPNLVNTQVGLILP